MTPTLSNDAGPVRAHGMDAGLTAPDWPPLTLAEVQALAPRYPALEGPLRLLWHSPRPFSAAARVQTGHGEVFIKRHDHRVRDVAALLEEHAFIAHLRERGAGVPRVLDNRERVSATALGARTYEVHAPVPGVDVYRDVHSWVPVHGVSDARALGAALARLHAAARGYTAAARPPRPLLAGIDIIGSADLETGLRRFVDQRPAVAQFLAQSGGMAPLLTMLQTVHPRFAALLPALEPLWVHNDWHASNLFWSAGDETRDVTAAIDFGLCNRGWAVADLATALERNTVAWLETDAGSNARSDTGSKARSDTGSKAGSNAGPNAGSSAGPNAGSNAGLGTGPDAPIGRLPLALALLDGYCSVRPLTAAEQLALPLLLPLAHVEYALSEVDYFHGILGNDANARLAYPQFLAGHIAWFAGAQGRAYREAIVSYFPARQPNGARPPGRHGSGGTRQAS